MIRLSVKTAAVALLTFAGTAHAAPFDISGGSYSLGTDYGCSGSGNTTNLFCAIFNNTIGNPAPFQLNNVGDSQTFNFGTIVFNEDGNTITAGEADNIGVTAVLNFADPIAGMVQSLASVGVFTGTINDAAVDYSLTFSPVTQAFGDGGLFEVDFADLSWVGNDTTPRAQTVKITLLAKPLVQDPEQVQTFISAIPEPGTLVLSCAALIGLAVARRRR
jgi:hypothetical protein